MLKNIFKPQIAGAFLCLLSASNAAVSAQYAIASDPRGIGSSIVAGE